MTRYTFTFGQEVVDSYGVESITVVARDTREAVARVIDFLNIKPSQQSALFDDLFGIDKARI